MAEAIFFVIVAFLPSVHAATWTYYDASDRTLASPTEQEIESLAVQRVSDTGLIQYALVVRHDFSETWGTGYLENIGNPTPAVGKHWIDVNQKVVCNVDGIVQDVYNMHSRYVTAGYLATGAPNAKDPANTLQFDGEDDHVSAEGLNFANADTFSIELWAKRERKNESEIIFSEETGFKLHFGTDNYGYFDIAGDTVRTSVTTTDDEWHLWRIEYLKSPTHYNTTWGYGFTINIYRDGVEAGTGRFEPACSTQPGPVYSCNHNVYRETGLFRIGTDADGTSYFKGQTKDGFIDEADGRTLYPQGHGDSWGHSLTALKGYYDLLGHPAFNWESRSEKFAIEGWSWTWITWMSENSPRRPRPRPRSERRSWI